MTFYNHIESVRGIAIDLTNGRKWRGASDKAAVFDALDAARREYMRLSDENAKLRELVCWLKKGDILHVLTDQEYIDQCDRERLMQVSIDALDKENAKLRELAKGMYGMLATVDAILGNHDACETPRPLIFGENKSFKDAMRELGVEE